MARRTKSFPDLASWLPEAQAQITKPLERFVRCLAVDHEKGEVIPFGSSVTAVWEGRPILLTANHVFERLGSRRLLLESHGEFRPLVGEVQIAASSTIDVAVATLPDDSFNWGLDFIELDIQEEPVLGPGEVETYIAMGYPVRESLQDHARERVHLKLINYWTFEDESLYSSLRKDPMEWVATKYRRTRTYQAGSQRAMKLPHGMSGGGLWRFWGPEDQFPSPERGALAGVLVEYREGPYHCMLSGRLGVLQALARELCGPVSGKGPG